MTNLPVVGTLPTSAVGRCPHSSTVLRSGLSDVCADTTSLSVMVSPQDQSQEMQRWLVQRYVR